ncbi:[FeFe] hydrogenase H-cluster maturation GTPase HydF [Clostridium gasigenes]|uniref:[FeFe] hydrogenase H-cluster maturation GTPase HydF n=1 Tax=Clostridium gasigenes TaxID=94869 RepID=UPI0014385869|nr:[FeFe] hydrogenase H-cluster maturation GTPase HydF [Clostridium gasigenes]MBU3137779.1 [FeFe] hydrogenase H-cluster maturation GTPase HydF [Clostridium gasigenes]NKF06108.1 [FeFe] hydrogenase H-cluster maturation GTPase HydF [Clostridium gasigenes]QSW19999.1 [FeFe] hydrogenase H-cluster maturation GTPase HydF [Clostridium gasigenes]
MNSTPNSNRKHIAIYGKTNAGKSSLINCLLNQEVSIVSKTRGTTTDPVSKAMELIPVGPVLFIDTAGLDDKSKLGEIRVKKTLEVLKKTDIGLYVMDINDLDIENYNEIKLRFKKYNIPYITVINKVDTASVEELNKVKEILKNVIFLSSRTGEGIETLKEELIKKIELEEEDSPLVGDLLPYNSKVILVVPIDSEAPKGRLILPQVQCIRDCLDHGIKSYVVRDTELESALEEIKDVDLVITDSQAFKSVDKIVPSNIKLTSFSILFARQKGDLDSFVQGAKKIEELNKDSKILISESCSHNISHEDIGRFKIPKMLNKYVGAELNYEFRVGSDFPEDIKKYDLIIHCGACMINRKTVINRINYCKENNVAITNYGVVIAYLTGILKRTLSIY